MAKSDRIFETATDTYRAKTVIGEGGAGIVYQVEDPDGQLFALKVLRGGSTVKRKRFRNELNFCQKEQHDNIVQILDSGLFQDEEGNSPFYVMPLYSGTLRSLMKAGIDPVSVLPFFDQILSGIEAAHLRGVYHRDLKPENILFDVQSNLLSVANFGAAHFSEEELLTPVETKSQERLGISRMPLQSSGSAEARSTDGQISTPLGSS